MLAVLFFYATVLALMGIGLFFVIGTLRRIEILVRPPKGWFYFYPYWFLKKYAGEKSIYYFHIFIGIVFILGAIGILLYALSF